VRTGFFREHWAERDGQATDTGGRFLRVNDARIALHRYFGTRRETRSPGLLLVPLNEDLFGLRAAELYLELWGGHPHTASKRFWLNGRGPYELPETGTEQGHCTYSYPVVALTVSHLVPGTNAFQFACDRGESFWGHFIIDNACVRAYLEPDHPDLQKVGLTGFSAGVSVPDILGDDVPVRLDCRTESLDAVQSVDYYARYTGFDDDGDGTESEWHGFTFKREPMNHVGTAECPPFTVRWDTRMIPTQAEPMALRAVVHLRDGFRYASEPGGGLTFRDGRPRVVLHGCGQPPAPFWSRAGHPKTATIRLPEDLPPVERAQLLVKVWDGGGGEVEEPFALNGHPYDVLSGRAYHDVVFTRAEVPPHQLRPGANEVRVLSDTEHHGIEVLYPGPCLLVRYR
jgi:hypothetical protein